MSFNTFYNQEADRSERTRAMNAIRHNVTDAQSQSLLSQLSDEIVFFTRLPPADTRKQLADPLYRQGSQDDLNIVNDLNQNASERLASLISVLYQVRCNLMHGDKDPDSKRDREVVKWSLDTLRKILPVLF